jgi:hypothetical protein
MNRLSRQCGILNISHPCRPPQTVTETALLFFYPHILHSTLLSNILSIYFSSHVEGTCNTALKTTGTITRKRKNLISSSCNFLIFLVLPRSHSQIKNLSRILCFQSPPVTFTFLETVMFHQVSIRSGKIQDRSFRIPVRLF